MAATSAHDPAHRPSPIRKLRLAAATLALAAVSGAHAQALGPAGAENSWQFVPGISALVTHDDNLFISSSNRQADTYEQLVPSLAVGIGSFRDQITPFADIPHFLALTGAEVERPQRDFAFVDYSPDFEFFDHYHGENTVNEDLRAAAQAVGERTRFQADVQVQSETEPDIDVGNRIRQDYATADLTGSYDVTGKITLGATGYANSSRYSGGIGSDEARLTVFGDDQVGGKTSLGAGVAYGTMWVQGQPDQDYGQALARWSYLPTAKLDFSGDLGAELRDFHTGMGSRATLVFNAILRYEATASTTLNAALQRQTLASALYGNADIDQTTIQGGVRQRLGMEFYGRLEGGFVDNQYYDIGPTPAPSRRDQYAFGRIGLAHDLTRHGTVELLYEKRRNDSTISEFGFGENLASLQASFLFRAGLVALAALACGGAAAADPAGLPTDLDAVGPLQPAVIAADYKIVPKDILEITVFQEPDLKSTARVSHEGTIDFPLIGSVAVRGLTPEGAGRAVAERLAKGYLIHPQVSVTVMEYSKRRFIVLGEVQKPGSYDMPDDGPVTVLQAIGIAGGYTRIADPRKVTVVRRSEGQEKVIRFDAKRMAQGSSQSDATIEPGDVITVAESVF